MKYIKVTIQELLAALKPSEFRPYIKEAVLKKEYKKYLDHIFKGKDRLYIPFEMENIIKIPRKIEDYLSDKDLKIVNYKSGLAENKDGRLTKIGKVLNKDDEGKQLLDLFNTSRSGVNKKGNLLIVISRHPYDIAGMSTGRGRDEPGDSKEGWGWSSCMNLRTGINRHYIHKDIENGALIAYVIDSEDKNINKPISRILLKQYINEDNPNDIILYPSNEIHGEKLKGFRERLMDWLKTFQTMEGFYYLNPNLYPGLDQKNIANITISEKSKTSLDSRVRLLYYKANPKNKDAKDPKEIDEIRELYYRNNPDDEQAKEDKNCDIRSMYYYRHPTDKQAKKDTDPFIRKKYYSVYTKDEDAKYDEDVEIRREYYFNNPNDEEAKNDEDGFIRYSYYIKHPKDEQAKYDKNSTIVNMYYKNNSEEMD